MSKGGGSTTTKTELPEFIDNAAKGVLSFGGQVANRPFQQYTGARVAPISSDRTSAWDAVRSMTDPGIGAARQSAMGFSNFTPDKVNEDYTNYMNPYTDEVVNRTLSDMDRSRTLAIQGNDDAALAAKAFGGNRQAVVDAITNSESQRNMGNAAAGLRSAGFDQASGKAFTAAQGNQAAGIAGAQIGLDASKAAGALGEAEQQAALQRKAAQEAGGAAQEQHNQADLSADQQKWGEWWNYPKDQLDTMLRTLGGTPYGSSVTSPTGGSSPLAGALGGAATGAGIYSALGLAAPWALPLAGVGGLLGAFS